MLRASPELVRLEAFCLPLGHVAQGALRAAVRQLAALVGVGAHLARANLWPTAVANGITGSKHASHAINSLCHATGASDGRPFQASVLAPYASVTVDSTAQFVDGVVVCASFTTNNAASNVQLHAHAFDGAMTCDDTGSAASAYAR